MFGKVIGKRLLFSAFILIAVSLLVFGATLLLPGDAARAILGQQATPERIAALNEQLGLDEPAWQRYFTGWEDSSSETSEPPRRPGGSVAALLGERIGASFSSWALAAIISVPLGIGLGVYQALHRGKRRDQAMTGISLVLRCYARVRHRHRAHRDLRDLGLPDPARRHPGPAGRTGVEPTRTANPADADARPRRHPLHRADDAGDDDRSPRLRVRRDGAAQRRSRRRG